jgi:hypothetical protein
LTAEVTFTGQSGDTWRYWTDRPLGAPGGFGAVYEAEGKDGAPMAVKVVAKHSPFGTLDGRLLLREIEIGKRVAESGSEMLLPVIDAGEDDNALLLVMDRAGKPLAAADIPMGEPAVITVMTDIATGLRDLHSAAIIHRDLKPANVLRHSERWKLADFGIARDQEIGTQDPTFIGAGSVPYMAPEIWNLQSPTFKTDLYALGCLAFELLAGAPPYTGDRAAVRAAHLSPALPDVPCTNIKLKTLITRLIAKDPANRPLDARAVLERLSLAQSALGPALEAIGRGLSRHDTERSRAEEKRAAAEAAYEAHRQQVAQAKADLREIIGDALEELQTLDPEITLYERGVTGPSAIDPTLALGMSNVKLEIQIWENMTTDEPVPGDTMILAACVMISNQRHFNPLNAANLVYEQAGDRLGWQIYKFRSHSLLQRDRYRYGPIGRTHGLRHGEFFDPRERGFMIHNPGIYAWRHTVDPLTADAALDLFQEAVDLQPPDPRTGLYPGSH